MLQIAADNAVFGQTGPKVGSFDAGYGSSHMVRLIGKSRFALQKCTSIFDSRNNLALPTVCLTQRLLVLLDAGYRSSHMVRLNRQVKLYSSETLLTVVSGSMTISRDAHASTFACTT